MLMSPKGRKRNHIEALLYWPIGSSENYRKYNRLSSEYDDVACLGNGDVTRLCIAMYDSLISDRIELAAMRGSYLNQRLLCRQARECTSLSD